MNANVDLSVDHNTTPPNICLGGLHPGTSCNPNSQCPGGLCQFGQCNGGANSGLSCDLNFDCGTCVSGPSTGAACSFDQDCGGTPGSCSTGTCNVGNGPGTCTGGTRDGLACSAFNTDCPGGGTCVGVGNGGGICVTGSNGGKVCHVDSDCPGSICNSPDDPTCSAQEPPPPTGSGAKSCLEKKEQCFGGSLAGQPCTQDADCGGSPADGISCGTDCNVLSPHPGVCNGPSAPVAHRRDRRYPAPG